MHLLLIIMYGVLACLIGWYMARMAYRDELEKVKREAREAVKNPVPPVRKNYKGPNIWVG